MTLMTLATILTVLSATQTSAGQTDTVFKARPGTRLSVSNFGGEIAVSTWKKNAVRVEARHSERVRVWVAESGSDFEVHAASYRGIVPRHVVYRITVPDWMALSLSGVYTDVTVEGSKGEVSAETVQGHVSLRGGEGLIKLSSVQGTVRAEGTRGRLEASSINEAVNLVDIVGDLSVEAVNGDVTLERIDSRMVEAATVNGDVVFSGAIHDGGRYHFASHSGDLIIAIPQQVNAAISVSTFNGDFDSSFPVRLTETKKGKRFNFVLGTGSAEVDLETFNGTINLRRALSLKPKE